MAGNQPLYQERLVFPLQPKHVHASSIVECPDGSLLCAWFRGSGERRSPDVVIQGARLKPGAASWSEVFPMADTPDLPDCNPVLFVGPTDELWLFWIAVPAERWEDSLLRFRQARNYGGEGPPRWDWQDDLLLKPGDRFAAEMEAKFHQMLPSLPGLDEPRGAALREAMARLQLAAWDPSRRQRGWMTRCHAVVLPSGRILLPLYSDGFVACLMAISDDQGRSWRASSPIIGPALNQPSVVRRKDGTLLAYLREESFDDGQDEQLTHRILVSESRDDGESWSLAEPTDLPNPNSSVEALVLRDGRWVLVYNDSETDRHTLALAMSKDEGRSWKWRRHLESTPGGGFHYPSIIQTRDGRIQVTYTHQPGANTGRSIKHVTLEPDWIRESVAEP
ncbi:MAG: exo-alpha-sialidase [Verrucomicrobiales bacterium]|nr:exo-alpha-sialidase [Verrucomicrobiales bacterium]